MFKEHHQRFLKVKIKSLAEESRIIRNEERKSSIDLAGALHQHRTQDVRNETRAALLAYGYLRGRELKTIETRKDHLDSLLPFLNIVKRAKQIVSKFGTNDASRNFQEWLALTQ